MAISSQFIGGNNATLQSFLQGTGFFGSVEYDSGTNTVTMKDSDNNVLATFSGNKTFTAYVDATNNASKQFTTAANYGIHTAYKCANGILLKFSGLTSGYVSYMAHILIAKTNNNKLAFIFSNTNAVANDIAYKQFYCVAWGDSTDIAAQEMGANGNNQTLMIPFVSGAEDGETSYTTDAYYLLYAQFYAMGYGKLNGDGAVYLTNGYWAIKDE